MPVPQEREFIERFASASMAASFTIVLVGPLLYGAYSSEGLFRNDAKDLKYYSLFTLLSAAMYLTLVNITAPSLRRHEPESAPRRENILSSIGSRLISGNNTVALRALVDLLAVVYNTLLREQVEILADGYQNLGEGIAYASSAVRQAISAPAPGRQAATHTPPQ